jgi:Domain of unknown function (DUF1788)
VSRIDDLAEQYERHISAPWQRNLAGAQRIIFVVYPKEDERRLLVKMKEFEHRTKAAGHGWREVDLTNTFPVWMAAEEYREEYFRHPEDLALKFDSEFADACAVRLREEILAGDDSDDNVLAVHGVAGLYGFTRLHFVLQKIESHIRGRLVVFFPGAYDQNAYRLLDARDGWNYLATPITGLASK